MMHYGYWGYPGMGGWAWGLGSIFSVIFWVVLIFLFISLFKHRSHYEEKEDNSALNILKERYAKGEITKKEFEEMKKDIG